MNTVTLVLLSPVALVVGLLVCICFAVGFVVMLNIYKSGKYPEVDYSNYVGRLLGFVQLSRHIPKLMKAVFVWDEGAKVGVLMDLPPGDYYIATSDGANPRRYTLTRPLLNMNRQDLMEQLDFRPDDGRVT